MSTSPKSLSGGEPASSRGLDEQVARIGTRLGDAFQAVLDQLPGAPHRPQALARELGINKDLSSRILKATEGKDPISITHAMPGPDPLRRLTRAAARRKVNGAVIREAEAATAEFESLIRNVAGDRGSLDTIISAWLPDVREKTELLSKQAVFKGMSQIKGTSAETEFVSRFVHPAMNGDGRDYALLSGFLGLRRLRPGAQVAINSFRLHGDASLPPLLTLDGQPLGGREDVVLNGFCSEPRPHFDIREEGLLTVMTLGGDGVGRQSAADIAWAHAHRSFALRGVFSTINIPTRKTVCDLFIHRDIQPRIDPLVEIYDTMERGVARFRDPDRALDRLDIRAPVEELGQGRSGFRCTEIPRYIEMIDHVCTRMGWEPSEFLGYRCAVEYPVYGSQIWMVFDPDFGGGKS